MSIDIGKLLNGKVVEFNSKLKDDPGMTKMIEGKKRSICISVSDGDDYYSRLENLKLDDFSMKGDDSTQVTRTVCRHRFEIEFFDQRTIWRNINGKIVALN